MDHCSAHSAGDKLCGRNSVLAVALEETRVDTACGSPGGSIKQSAQIRAGGMVSEQIRAGAMVSAHESQPGDGRADLWTCPIGFFCGSAVCAVALFDLVPED